MKHAWMVTCVAGVALGLAVNGAWARSPLSTAFTYQGQLKQASVPVNSTADFEFSLWDALDAGNQVGTTVDVNNVTVAGGLFTVELDFGCEVFDGQARWLGVAVRAPAGGGDFTTLSPRQPLTAVPYALQTRGLYVDAAANVGLGTTNPQHPLSIGDGTADTQAVALRSYSNTPPNWKGGAAFGHDSATVIVGELGDVATIGGHNANLSAWADLAINLQGNVGIGTAAPTEKLTVAGTVQSTEGGFKFPDGTVQDTAAGSGIWTRDDDDIYFDSGNVGIGRSSAWDTLQVNGRIHATTFLGDGTGLSFEDCSLTGDGLDCTQKILVGVDLHEEDLLRLDTMKLSAIMQGGEVVIEEEVVLIDIEKRWRQPAPTDNAFDVHLTLTMDPDTYAFSVSPESPIYDTRQDPQYPGTFRVIVWLVSSTHLSLTFDADKVKRIAAESPGYIVHTLVEPYAPGATEAQLSVRIRNDGDLKAMFPVTVTECDFPVEPVLYQPSVLEATEEVDLTFDLVRASGTFVGGETCKVSMFSKQGKLFDFIVVTLPGPTAAAPTASPGMGGGTAGGLDRRPGRTSMPLPPAATDKEAEISALKQRLAKLEALVAELANEPGAD